MFGYDELWSVVASNGALTKQLYPRIQLNGPLLVQLLLVVLGQRQWVRWHGWNRLQGAW